MKRALLIYNPAAGGRRDAEIQARRITELLQGAGFDVERRQTEAPGHAEDLARRAGDEHLPAVFSFGGDGTLRECAAGLLGSDTALGFLPGGTANVMSRVLGLPQDPLRAAALLAHGSSMPIDVGLCGRRPMLMQASAGLDAAVLAGLDPARKRWLGKGEVALNFIPAWWSFSYPAFEVRWHGNRRAVTFAAACNIPFYGGPWKLAPDASWNDGLLDLVMFTGSGRSAVLGFALDLALNRHHRREDVEIVRTDRVEIAAAEGLELQIDGDFFADALPAPVHLSTRQVHFLIPDPESVTRPV